MANLPYTPPQECEDAAQFFRKMKEIDDRVATRLNEKHEKAAERVNRNRRDFEPFQVADLVWYLRPEDAGDKLDSRWLGPGVIVARIGGNSYEVELKPGFTVNAHRSALKAFVKDPTTEDHTPLFSIDGPSKIRRPLPKNRRWTLF